METGFSYSPGESVYHDLVFAVFLVIASIVSYWSLFYGIRYIVTPDKKRILNNEPYALKLIIKIILLLYPMAVFVGFPLFLNLLSFVFVLLIPIFSMFDSTISLNYVVWAIFIILYILYFYLFFKKVNRRINNSLDESIEFYSDWDFPHITGVNKLDQPVCDVRRNDTMRTVLLYKGVVHFSVVPVILLTVLHFLYEIF